MSNPFGDKYSTYFKYQSRDKAFSIGEESSGKNLNSVLTIVGSLFILVLALVLFIANTTLYSARNKAEITVSEFNTQTMHMYDVMQDSEMLKSLEKESEDNDADKTSSSSAYLIKQMKKIMDDEYDDGKIGVSEGMSTTQAIQNVAPYFATCDAVSSVNESLPSMQTLRESCRSYADASNDMMQAIIRYNYLSQESIIGSISFGNNKKYPDITTSNIDDLGVVTGKMGAQE